MMYGLILIKHMMSTLSYCMHTFTLSLLIHVCLSRSAETHLAVTVPIEAVEEGGVFSVHCQVWNLAENMEVTIYRRVGENQNVQKLSTDEGVDTKVPDNVFLAVRQLNDGSKIFFLTLMEAKKEDQGEYVCKVQAIDADVTTLQTRRKSVTIDVLYFPDEKDPLCSPNSGQVYVESGREITLNCSSELGNPVVEIEWTRSGTDIIIPSTNKNTGAGVTFAELRIKPTLVDDKAVYICKISSAAFPREAKTCHIALMVIGDDSELDNAEQKDVLPVTQRPPKELVTLDSSASEEKNIKCKDICDNKSVFYWVLATVIATLIALIFLIISIVLLIRYHFASRFNSEEHYMPANRHPREDIYTELEGRLGDNVVFMKLPKPIAPEHNVHNIPSIQMQR